MANLYLIDKPAAEQAFELAKADKNAKVVLIQDGVYLDSKGLKEVYAVKRDIDLRGLGTRVPASVKRIGYDELVDLIVANKVINFA